MQKRILAVLLCVCLMLTFAACKSGKEDISSSGDVPTGELGLINPLTGVKVAKDISKNKVVGVTINNLKKAQAVQTGLSKFDIVYEIPVEGGITRMMGVTQDISALPQIGTVRSARKPFLELAQGHNAIYVHAGYDYFHFAPLRKSMGIETFDINTGKYSKFGFRQQNGLSSEHTMYTSGEKLADGMKQLGFPTTAENTAWLSFNDEASPVRPGAVGNSVSVKFSHSAISEFTYNSETNKYTKGANGTVWKDYLTGEGAEFTNVFVLFTTVTICGDEKHHSLVELQGGTGYYISNGGYEEISWSKADTNSPLSFKRTDGTPLTANAGNSFVCITNIGSQVTIQ